MKRFLKSTLIGLGLLGMLIGTKVSYAQTLEYALLLPMLSIIPIEATQQRLSSGLRISSAKDDATGITKYSLTITNAQIPTDAMNVELMIRYTAKDGKEYVTKTGFTEDCHPSNVSDEIDLVCPFTGSGSATKSDSSSVTGTTSTSITR